MQFILVINKIVYQFLLTNIIIDLCIKILKKFKYNVMSI